MDKYIKYMEMIILILINAIWCESNRCRVSRWQFPLQTANYWFKYNGLQGH